MAEHHKKRSKNFQPVKRPGALTKKAESAGESVQEFAKEHYNSPGRLGKQARFAEIAKKWHHGGHKGGKKRHSKVSRKRG